MKAQHFYLSCIIMSLLCGACSDKGHPPVKPTAITIIVDRSAIAQDEKLISTKLSYYDRHQLHQTFSVRKAVDTIDIPYQGKGLEISCRISEYDHFTYLFQAGDSVLFTYQKGLPFATIMNQHRSPDPFLNYDLYKRDSILAGQAIASEMDRRAILIHLDMVQADVNHKSFAQIGKLVEDSIQSLTAFQLKQELAHLNALWTNQQIDSSTYAYRKTKALFEAKKISLKKTLQWDRWLPTEKDLEAEDLAIYDYADGAKQLAYENVLDDQAAPLQAYGFYHELLFAYLSFYGKKVSRIERSFAYEGQPGGGFNQPDFLERFQLIQSKSHIGDSAKKLLARIEAKNIVRYKSIDEKEQFLQEYEHQFTDSAFLYQLAQTYKLTKAASSDYDLQLLSQDGETHSFKEILKQEKGKLIFADFWSSTCRPCLEEMPAFKRLRESFVQDSISFIQLSLDTDRESWEKSCQRLDLQEKSYLILNKFTSREYEELAVEWIPHYMVFDQEGKQLIASAPRPSDAQTKSWLQSLFP
ncbi:MAG: TlpA disulfide reductase family protein [Bacteroidota bacterium]